MVKTDLATSDDYGVATVLCFDHPVGDVCDACREIRRTGPQLARLPLDLPVDSPETVWWDGTVRERRSALRRARRAALRARLQASITTTDRMKLFLDHVRRAG